MGNAISTAGKQAAKAVSEVARQQAGKPGSAPLSAAEAMHTVLVDKAAEKTIQSSANLPIPPLPRLVEADKYTKVMNSFVADAKQQAGASQSADQQPSIEELKARIEQDRPATFRRLDDNGSSASAVTEVGEDSPLSSTTPLNPVAAEIAQQSRDSFGGQQVAVQRVLSSGPSAGPSIHDKNLATLTNVSHFDGSIQTRPDDSVGVRNFKLFEAMQLNPKLLDTGAALASSPGQMIAAQMAAGMIPASARGDLPQITSGKSKADKEAAAAAGAATSDSTPTDALVAAERADALIPAHSSVDEMLLLDDRPKNVALWAPRPPETSPFDQLVLHNAEEEFQLDRNEMFELFARHKADPEYWTAERLAIKFDTKVEWVSVLLQYTSPPIYCQVDGDAYGVYAIRSMNDLHDVGAPKPTDELR